jgi:hypothetical protein
MVAVIPDCPQVRQDGVPFPIGFAEQFECSCVAGKWSCAASFVGGILQCADPYASVIDAPDAGQRTDAGSDARR